MYDRFEIKYSDDKGFKILVDKITGVNYLLAQIATAPGLAMCPLIKWDGKPVVTENCS